jgi:hypothetical protein
MLVIWSLLGGAVCRIIAVDAALDEKISLREAIGFAREKFIGFLVAPLIPYLLVLVIGICLVLGGLIGAIPYVGEIFAGLFFFLALIGGFLIALLVIGAVVGSSLMYPTIAVEGSDAFDAISRSFSYVLTRPWHTLLYAAVSIVYGAICYLFARIVVYLLLAATHLFVGAGMTGFGTWNQHENGLGKLDLMWQMPTFSSLVPRAGAETAGTEYFASWLIALWVWVVVGLLYAFVGSLALSGVTTIYYLLRHDADGTDYEDVYIDEEDVDLAAPPPPPPTVTEFAAPAEDDSIDHDASGSETGDDVDA